MPAQEVAVAAYDDETHVNENRSLYAQKFDLADQIIGDRYGYRRPAGGFFLWLDVSAHGGSARAAERFGARRACACCRANTHRARQPTALIRARDYIRVAHGA